MSVSRQSGEAPVTGRFRLSFESGLIGIGLVVGLPGFLLPGDSPVWSLTQLAAAIGGAPATWARITAALLLLLGAGFLIRRAPALPRLVTRVVPAGGFLILAWFFRDRNHLLGDTALWVRSIESYGARLDAYREPLAARGLGLLADLSRDFVGVSSLLAAVSVLCGLIVMVALAAVLNRGRAAEDPARRGAMVLALALLLAQPLSFVFFGYAETYPLFLAVLALTLRRLHGDLEAGRPGWPALLLLLLLGLTHLTGFLATACLLATRGVRKSGRGGLLLMALAITAALALFLLAVPPLRVHAVLAQPWTAGELGGYLLDVLNGWLVVSAPLGIVAAWRPHRPATTFERFTALLVLTFLALPLAARFELGLYRDLDILSPAAVGLAFLLAARWPRDPGMARPVRLAALLGAPFLAAWLTLGIAPAGAARFERLLDRPGVQEEKRSYGYEVASSWHRDRGEFEPGAMILTRALDRTPGNDRLRGALGALQLQAGDTAAALPNLTRGLQSSRWHEAAGLLAEALTRRGHPAQAIAILSARRSQVAARSSSAAALATAFYMAGQPDSTVAVARERLLVSSEDAVAWFNLSAGLVATGQPEAAFEALDRAVALAPERTAWRRQLLILKQQLGR